MKMMIDVNEDQSDNEEEIEECNIAFIAYPEGSYFGDHDILFNDDNKGRDSTAIAENECHLLILHRKDLL